MNNSYRINQKQFFKKYGPVADFDNLTHVMINYMHDQIGNCQTHLGGKNELLGVKVDTSYVTQEYTGRSIKTAECQMGISDIVDSEGYSGTIWFRTAEELKYSAKSTLFSNSMFHIGTGGYSTWNGPWQDVGMTINRLESIIPVDQRRPFAAYAFSFQFYVSDFPGLDQMAIMHKLSDEGMPDEFSLHYESPGLNSLDKNYISFLEKYREDRKT